MGIKVEMEHTKDPEKALDIAMDHLSEDPFYYTKLKMAGLADELEKPKKKKRTDIPVEATSKNTVDKANATKPVKGVEKPKASANKAHKETVKPAKGVQQLTHKAKKAKGIKQVMPSPGKEKTIKEVIDTLVKKVLSEKMSFGDWTVVGDPGKKKKSSSSGKATKKAGIAPSSTGSSCSCGCNTCGEGGGELNEDHLHSREDQIKYILQNKEAIKQKDEISPEWFDGKTDQFINKLYQALEKKVKQNKDLGDQEPEFHALKESKKKLNELNEAPKQGEEFTLTGDIGDLKEGDKVTIVSVKPDTEDTTAIQIILRTTDGKEEDIYVDKDDDWAKELMGNNDNA